MRAAMRRLSCSPPAFASAVLPAIAQGTLALGEEPGAVKAEPWL